jgi:beta-lactamase regulating signal transducer with metallopeptidase domain
MNLPIWLTSPVGVILLRWTCLLALGWGVHGLLRHRHARWRLILWRGILCFGLALPLLHFLQVPGIKIPVTRQATHIPEAASSLPPQTVLNPVQHAPSKDQMPPAAAAASSPAPSIQSPHVSAPPKQIPWGTVFLLIWTLGCVSGAIRLLRLHWQLSRLRRATGQPSPDLQRLAKKIQAQLKVQREPALRISEAVTSPFVCGLLRPAIVLPRMLLEQLSPGELAALLTHEMAHLRHHDLLWSVAWRWLGAICWFHPLVWRIPAAHNLACDQEADRVASGQMAEQDSYSQSLARLALRVLALPAVETNLTLNGSSQIARRLIHLGRVRTNAWNWRHSVAGVGLVGSLFLMTVGWGFSRTELSYAGGAPQSPDTEKAAAAGEVPEQRLQNDALAAITTRPAEMPKPESAGPSARRPVTIKAERLDQVADQLSTNFNAVVCSESSTNEDRVPLTLALEATTLQDALDRFVSVHTQYLWKVDATTGFINLYPRENSMLDWKIDSLSFTDKTAMEIFWVQGAGLGVRAGTNAGASRGSRVASRGRAATNPGANRGNRVTSILKGILLAHGIQVFRSDFPLDWSDPIHLQGISLDLRSVTARDAINRVCAQTPSKRWDLYVNARNGPPGYLMLNFSKGTSPPGPIDEVRLRARNLSDEVFPVRTTAPIDYMAPSVMGEWSERVNQLRGRLLFGAHATAAGCCVYLEIENSGPDCELYYDVRRDGDAASRDTLRGEMRDGTGAVFSARSDFKGVDKPKARWLVLKGGSSAQFRVAIDGNGFAERGQELLPICLGWEQGNVWGIPWPLTGDYFLSATVAVQAPNGVQTPSGAPPWSGILKLPPVKIPKQAPQ